MARERVNNLYGYQFLRKIGKSLKICHLTSVHNRDDVRIFYKECKSLSESGYEVHLIVADDIGDENKEGINIHDVGSAPNRFVRISGTIWKVLKKCLEVDAEVYHFHDPELIPVGLWLKFKGKKVIYDVHEDLPRQILSKEWIHPWYRGLVSKFAEIIENFSARRFSSVVTATPFILKRFEKITDKAVNINNYPILKEVKKKIPWDSRETQICYVGGISEVRGIIPLIDAIENLGVKLNLAGNYSSEDFRNLLKNKNGWSNVIEYGYVEREVVQDILDRSKIGVVTLFPLVNYLDSLPIKMFEYMASGIPFIASDFPYWQSIVDKHDCGICVDPTNSEKIGETINYLFTHPELAERMGKNGREAVMQHYHWANEADNLVNLYRIILSANS